MRWHRLRYRAHACYGCCLHHDCLKSCNELACAQVEADTIIYGDDFVIIVETDQEQHNGYKKVCEVDRQEMVKEIFPVPVHLVRFRPKTRHREADLVKVVQDSINSRAACARPWGLFISYIGYTPERVVALHAEASVVFWGERLNGAPFPHEVRQPFKLLSMEKTPGNTTSLTAVAQSSHTACGSKSMHAQGGSP